MEEPMYNAAGDGDVVTIRRLAAEGVDVNVPGDGGARTLHMAAQEGHVNAVQVLVEVGADVEASTLLDRDRCTSRYLTGMWRWPRRLWSSVLMWRHLLLMDTDRCTWRHMRGMWRWPRR